MRADGVRFLKFLGVGVLNTAFGLGAYWALIFLGFGPQVALAIAFAMGVVWNFTTHARLVFGTRGYRRLAPYVVAYTLIYAVNAVTLQFFLAAGIGPYLAQALLVLPMAVLSFFLISLVLTGRMPLGRRKAGEEV